MSRRAVGMLSVIAALTAAAPAAAATPSSVTATGTKLVRVVPANRHNNASIVAAVAAAQKAGISGALDEARQYATRYATAAGLTLGSVISVSDVQNNNGGFYGSYGSNGSFGPFGVNQYCGIEHRPVFKRANGKQRLVRVRKVHACIVPRFQATTLTVTYAAS